MKPFNTLLAMRAVRDLPLSCIEKGVLFALTMRADEIGRCWPSYTTIATDAGVSLRSAKAAVASLVKAGHVRSERRPVEGKRECDSNLYTVEVVHHVHDVVQEVHHVVQEVHGGGAGGARQVVQGVHGGGAPRALEEAIEETIGRERVAPLALAPPEAASGGRRRGKRKRPTERPERRPDAAPLGGRQATTAARPEANEAAQSSLRAPGAKSARGTRLPEGWTPKAETLQRFRTREHVDASGSLERFRNHWLAKAGAQGVKVDWEATFRNWVLEDIARGRAVAIVESEPLPGIPADALDPAENARRAKQLLADLLVKTDPNRLEETNGRRVRP